MSFVTDFFYFQGSSILVVCNSNSLIFITEHFSISRVYHILFTHSLGGEYLGCFYLLAIRNDDAMNIHVHRRDLFTFLALSFTHELVPKRFAHVSQLVWNKAELTFWAYEAQLRTLSPDFRHITEVHPDVYLICKTPVQILLTSGCSCV